jgi:hypothetical protein
MAVLKRTSRFFVSTLRWQVLYVKGNVRSGDDRPIGQKQSGFERLSNLSGGMISYGHYTAKTTNADGAKAACT